MIGNRSSSITDSVFDLETLKVLFKAMNITYDNNKDLVFYLYKYAVLQPNFPLEIKWLMNENIQWLKTEFPQLKEFDSSLDRIILKKLDLIPIRQIRTISEFKNLYLKYY
jgi:hypothetical protein